MSGHERLARLHGERWAKADEFLRLHEALETDFSLSVYEGPGVSNPFFTLSWDSEEMFGRSAIFTAYDDGDWVLRASDCPVERCGDFALKLKGKGPLKTSWDFAEFVQRWRSGGVE